MSDGAGGLTEKLWADLRRAAEQARARAYAPYSGFAVGAALIADDGKIYAGCNVENASYGLTICAERSAVVRMVGAGGKSIKAVYIVAAGDQPIPPCGACRQVLQEFGASQTPIRMANMDRAAQDATLGQLLPFAFSKEDLDL